MVRYEKTLISNFSKHTNVKTTKHKPLLTQKPNAKGVRMITFNKD